MVHSIRGQRHSAVRAVFIQHCGILKFKHDAAGDAVLP